MRLRPLNPDHLGELRQKPADFIATHPAFSLAEFRENQRQRGLGHQAARAILKYHLRTGRIFVVRRGVYAHRSVDPWLLGSRLAPDAVLGYGGALSFRGIGGLGWQIAYLTAHPRRNVEWNEVIYEPVRVDNPELWPAPRTETVQRCGLPVTVELVEHALVDVFHRQDLGPLLAAVEHLRHARPLSLRSVLDRARTLQRSTLNARLGYVLNLRPDMPGADLAQLERSLPAAPVWFDATDRGGTLIPRWRVRVPRAVREVVEGHLWWTQEQRRAFTPPLSSATPPRHSVE